MSLLADLVGTWRDARGTQPTAAAKDVRYTSQYHKGIGSVFKDDAAPTIRELQATVQHPTFRSVLDLISSEVGGIEWHLYRKFTNPAPERNRKAITNRPEWELWDQPNMDMTGYQVRKLVEWHYQAVGEGYMICDYLESGSLKLPGSFWPVRPDRMCPVPVKTGLGIAGWVYKGPDSEKVPLEKEEVMRIYNPHPIDWQRGTGAAQSLLPAIAASLTGMQFLKAFYANDATPGGMIELGQDEIMEEDEYRQLLSRWNDRHKGVSRAHRVGILEVGTYKQIQVNMKEMQFTEMRNLTRDEVLEAVRVHKQMLGISEDVNRANAEAGKAVFAENTTLNRAKDWYAFANKLWLPSFGPLAETLELCYENPVPEDQAADDASLESRSRTFKTLTDAGMSHEDAAQICGLPEGLRYMQRGGNGEPSQGAA